MSDNISIKEFFCQKLNALEKRIELQFDLQKIALDKASDQMESRLEGMNEFRSAMKDQTALFITRAELELKLESERKGRRDNIALFLSIVSIVLVVWKMIVMS
jgi:hypothetical protein